MTRMNYAADIAAIRATLESQEAILRDVQCEIRSLVPLVAKHEQWIEQHNKQHNNTRDAERDAARERQNWLRTIVAPFLAQAVPWIVAGLAYLAATRGP